MINNSFSILKEIIVGKELNIPTKMVDFTFKHFFRDNLTVSQYNAGNENISIDHNILKERQDDLDTLAATLEDLGIIVHRPESVDTLIPIKTFHYTTYMAGAGNVRDLTLMCHDYLIETPVIIRSRVQENKLLYNIFRGLELIWIKAPEPKLEELSTDTDDWRIKKDYKSLDLKGYDISFDAAQCIVYKDVLVINISNINHYLGYKWLKKVLPINVYYVEFTDNHIDGLLNIISDRVFLANPQLKESEYRAQLPSEFDDFKYIFPEKSIEDNTGFATQGGMDVNVLNIDENTVLVNNDAHSTIKVLEENGYKVIPIQLRHNKLLEGGIHCSTLEINRECI